MRICFCQDLIKPGIITLTWVEGNLQIADILTKTLGSKLFNQFRVSMGFLEDDEVHLAMSGSATSASQSSSMKSEPKSKQHMYSLMQADGTLKVFASVKQSSRVETQTRHVSGAKQFPSVLIEASDIDKLEQKFDVIIIEICCAEASALATNATKVFPSNTLVIRCTKSSPLEDCHAKIVELLKQHHQGSNRFSFVHFLCHAQEAVRFRTYQRIRSVKMHFAISFFVCLNFTPKSCFFVLFGHLNCPKEMTTGELSQPVQEFIMRSRRPVYANLPKLCMCGGPIVSKTFLFTTNHKVIASCLEKFTHCSHTSHAIFNNSKWSRTGRYPERLVLEVLIHLKSIVLQEDARPEGGNVMHDPANPVVSFSANQLFTHPITSMTLD